MSETPPETFVDMKDKSVCKSKGHGETKDYLVEAGNTLYEVRLCDHCAAAKRATGTALFGG